MKNEDVPQFFSTLLPGTVAQNTNYNLRNNQNFNIPRFRLTSTNLSFVPSALRQWNELDVEVRSLPSFQNFKKAITEKVEKAPSYFDFGERRSNNFLTKLRHRCSSLKYDLFRVNIIESPESSCGNPCENVFHFLLECPNYIEQRRNMLVRLAFYTADINVELLLNGS